ncbi:nucleotide sugar dehydrogenase [Streptomyces caelestis]|uniref:CcbL n=1 Tax=Streptomyces caelestis TaxID=36816 RepID=E9JES3_9ACTN|nr:nucleotide sugar dehydrogenase [Streptomyces caelestis]ADB92561.1 CcbL [Streptomyces caelestis]MBB5794802.1 UDPglucose 6-dehydrogenase [Streptomyces caelestis]GGW28104.1 UDP-glucose 6-dehydrogenase [Streptomyces caelestis]
MTSDDQGGAAALPAEISVCGLWHLGTTVAAGLLSRGHQVVGYDPDDGLRRGAGRAQAPTGEPGVGDALAAGLREQRLRITGDIADWARSTLCLLTYDSAVDAEGGVADDRLDAAVAAFAEYGPRGAVLVVLSQVPAGTHTRWRGGLLAGRPDLRIVHVPENLRLGEALADFLEPPRLVIGAEDDTAARLAAALFPAVESANVSLTEAELVKHATNAYLGLCVAFANELAWIGFRLGADPTVVARLLKTDPRISPRAPLLPGAAFSGSTLQRDLVALRRLGTEHGRAELFDSVLSANQRHAYFAVDLLRAHYGGLAGRRVAVAGLTYKPTTRTLRDSLPLRLVHQLLAEGAVVSAYDPLAEELPGDLAVERAGSLAACVKGADALLIGSALPELADTDWSRLAPAERLVADGCVALSPEVLRAAGWQYLGMRQVSGS